MIVCARARTSAYARACVLCCACVCFLGMGFCSCFTDVRDTISTLFLVRCHIRLSSFNSGLQHLQTVLSALRDIMVSTSYFSVNVVARRIYNVENAHDELRQLDRMEQDPTAQKVIVFDLSSEKAYKDILRQVTIFHMFSHLSPFLLQSNNGNPEITCL